MWPFGPRLVNYNGRMLTPKAIRGLEKENLRKEKARTDKAVKSNQLDSAKAQDEYVGAKNDKKQGKKSEQWRKIRAGITGRIHQLVVRLDNNRPLLAALVLCGLCMVATFAGQLMVYTDLDWHGYKWIAFILPVIVEGATWTFAIYAQWLASRPKPLPYGAQIRMMWFFAIYAAAVNTYHIAIKLEELPTGALVGGASIVGPLIWHRYVSLTKKSRSGRTAEQIRMWVGRRVNHPIVTWRATALWSAAGGALTPDQAWLMTYQERRGHLPGQRRRSARQVTQRHNWLWRLVRPITGAVRPVELSFRVVRVVVVSAEQPCRWVSSQRADQVSAERSQRAELAADSGDLSAAQRTEIGPAELPLSALSGGAPSATVESFDADFLAWQEELAQRADEAAPQRQFATDLSAEDSAQNTSSKTISGANSAHRLSAAQRVGLDAEQRGSQRAELAADSGDLSAAQRTDEAADQRAEKAAPQRSISARQRRRSARQVSGRIDYTGPITEYFQQRVAAGVDPDTITGPEVAKATGAAESTARNILRTLRGNATK